MKNNFEIFIFLRYLTKEGIDICKEDLGSKSDRASMKDIINAALNVSNINLEDYYKLQGKI